MPRAALRSASSILAAGIPISLAISLAIFPILFLVVLLQLFYIRRVETRL